MFDFRAEPAIMSLILLKLKTEKNFDLCPITFSLILSDIKTEIQCIRITTLIIPLRNLSCQCSGRVRSDSLL